MRRCARLHDDIRTGDRCCCIAGRRAFPGHISPAGLCTAIRMVGLGWRNEWQPTCRFCIPVGTSEAGWSHPLETSRRGGFTLVRSSREYASSDVRRGDDGKRIIGGGRNENEAADAARRFSVRCDRVPWCLGAWGSVNRSSPAFTSTGMMMIRLSITLELSHAAYHVSSFVHATIGSHSASMNR